MHWRCCCSGSGEKVVISKRRRFLSFVFLGIATLGVYLLGQGGEDFVEELPGVSHDAIENHESVAAFALGSVIILAMISLFALVRYKGYALFRRRSEDDEAKNSPLFPAWIAYTVLLVGLVSSGILGYTGRLGGKIRHTEFHDGAQQTIERDGKDGEDGEKGRGRNRGRR